MANIGIFLLFAIVSGNDYILWSDKQLKNVSLKELIKNDESIVFGLEEFSLSQFSKYANAYNNKGITHKLVERIYNGNYVSGYLNDRINISSIKNLAKAFTFNEIEDMLKSFENKYDNFVIMDSNDIEDRDKKRSKRVVSSALDDMNEFDNEERSTTISSTVPIIMPKYEKGMKPEDSPCLFYLEGVTLHHHAKSKALVYKSIKIDFTKKNTKDKFIGTFDCYNITKTSKFTINIRTQGVTGDDTTIKVPKNSEIEFEITVKGDSYYSWSVDNLILKKATISIEEKDYQVNRKKLTSQRGSKFLDINGFYDYSYVCSETPAIFAASDVAENYIGISLVGLQLQMHSPLIDKENGDQIFYGFSHKVNDCVPTFSPGSWMGIIVTVVFISILIFAMLMLNSIHSADRFDDPKNKPLVINYKE